MARQLTELERELALSISIDLFDGMIQSQRGMSSVPAGHVHDQGQRNLESGLSALASLGFVESVPGKNNLYRVVHNPDDPIALPHGIDRSDLDSFLEAYVYNAEYTEDLRRSTDEPERREETIMPRLPGTLRVCEALAKCSYMVRRESGTYAWARAIGPWFVECGYWELTEFDECTEAEIDRVVEAIPSEELRRLSGSLFDYQPMFARFFFSRWFDGTWHNFETSNHGTPSDDWDLAIGAGVYRRLHS